jgi:hypothetical protein
MRDGIQGKVAEVLVRRYASEEFVEVRVAVVGNVDSGKSTLLGNAFFFFTFSLFQEFLLEDNLIMVEDWLV